MTSPPGASSGHDGSRSDPYDFSVVLGGPLYQIVRRTHLSGDGLELLRRRLLVIPLFTWLPLLILSIVDGHAWGPAVTVPFLKDIEAHVRLLVALPLLILAEIVVHQRMRSTARQFLERGLIADTSRGKFDAAVASAVRLRNSVTAEVVLLVFVYVVGVFFVWPRYIALNVATWYSLPSGGARSLHPAGWWFVFVSLPLFQFILFRWYFRIFIWIRFLWQVARCELRLVATHPDRRSAWASCSLIEIACRPCSRPTGRCSPERSPIASSSRARCSRTSRRSWWCSPCSCCSSCWDRSCSSRRTSRRPGAPACANTARSPSSTCVLR